MRRLIAASLLTAGLALASVASAGTTTPATAGHPAAPHAASKAQQCQAAWTAQTHHTGTRAAFLRACMHRG
jgi:hypothetical protein